MVGVDGKICGIPSVGVPDGEDNGEGENTTRKKLKTL